MAACKSPILCTKTEGLLSPFLDQDQAPDELQFDQRDIEECVQKIFDQTISEIKPLHLFKPLREQYIDVKLSPVYKKILEDKPKYIIINVSDCEGFGDILFALKLVNLIRENDPSINIAIVFEDETTKKKTESVSEEYPHLKDCYYLLENLPKEFKDPRVGLCIGPATYHIEKSSDLDYDRMGLDATYPFLKLPEYSHEQENVYSKHVKTTGLQDHEYGIFIDRRLIQTVEEEKERGINPVTHVNELSDKNLAAQILKGRSIEAYSKESKLYFGYGHKSSSQAHFIRAAVHTEKLSTQNIDMVLVLDDPQELNLKLLVDLTNELETQGIGKVEIVHQTSAGEISTSMTLSNPSKKTLRIITRKAVSHKDFERCLLMSQPLTLVTGDQSLSEAFSTNKIFLYEFYLHKDALKESLEKLAQNLNLPLVARYFTLSIITERNFYEQSEGMPWALKYIPYYQRSFEDYDELSSGFLLNEEFKKQWSAFLSYVQKNKSLNDKVMPLINRLLVCNHLPHLSEMLDSFLEKT